MSSRIPPVGTIVGAHRWPCTGSVPGKPWEGEVLAENDPRAWAGTIAFPYGTPTQEEVDKHVSYVHGLRIKEPTVPVLWNFGRVYWEKVGGEYGVKPIAEDIAAWRAELARLNGQRTAA